MAKELFVYAKTRSKFLAQKLQGKIDDSQIGIIAETGEFWFQDNFYPLIAVAKVAFSGSYLDLEDKPTIPSAITENTVSDWGFTKNNGTITEVKMNGESKGKSGVVDLGTVLTEHQDISGKVDKVQGKGLSTNDFTSELKSKLENLKNYDDTKLQETLSALRREVTLIVSKNTNDSIESLEEVIEFLSGFKDDAKLHDIVSLKMDKPSSSAMLGLPNKVMTWDGYTVRMSLPIADGLDDWGKTDGTSHGYLVTDQQVQAKIDSIANKSEVVDFANDLTGVLEATAEEFTFRPSAGDKSIRDESAVIRKIKGNTIVARRADNTSEVLPMKTIGIETIGFNQWDEQWELGALSTADGAPVGDNERGRSVNFFDVIPNASYYCATIAQTTTNSGGTVGSMGVWWYDSNKTMIKYEDITNRTRVAPSNARYAKICSYGGDVNKIFNSGININLSHSGVRDGEYEPYKRNIRTLPEIYKYFPDGMNGNANVWDEINTEKAIKRWGVVDLGTLTWSVQQASANIFWSNSVAGLKKAPYGSYPNAISIFDTGRFYDLQVAKSKGITTEIISVHDSQARIMLYNPNYEATTEGASQLKASLQGVLLYYELTEPEYTDITEPMQLDYEVEDFGTEKALSLASSAPFRADIVYQFNAEGRIRDNSRNIERVENNMQRVENTVTTRLIPSSTAMLGLPNKVMTWDGYTVRMSLPIADGLGDWGKTDGTPYGYLVTDQQVMDYVESLIITTLNTPV